MFISTKVIKVYIDQKTWRKWIKKTTSLWKYNYFLVLHLMYWHLLHIYKTKRKYTHFKKLTKTDDHVLQ